MIKRLESSDLPLLMDGASQFFAEGKLPGRFDPVYFISRWADVLSKGGGVIIGMFGPDGIQGAIGGYLYKDINNGDYQAIEGFWYVIEKYRGRGVILLRAFEDWAREVGAKRVAMIHLLHLHPDKLKDLYERLGYHAVEISYIKEL